MGAPTLVLLQFLLLLLLLLLLMDMIIITARVTDLIAAGWLQYVNQVPLPNTPINKSMLLQVAFGDADVRMPTSSPCSATPLRRSRHLLWTSRALHRPV